MTQEQDQFDLDAIERAQQAEDGEIDLDDNQDAGDGVDGAGDVDETGEGDTGAGEADEGGDGQAQDQDPADQQAAQGNGEGDGKPAKPQGIASKDGSRVLPYSALTEARNKAKRAAEEVERLRAENEALKAGKTGDGKPAADELAVTDEELAELENEHPSVAKVARVARAATKRLAELESQASQRAAPVDASEPSPGDRVQEAIDANPDLLTWQSEPEHASKFQRAVEMDNFLKTSPKWRDKPLHERFAEATRRVREEFDLPEPEPATATRQQQRTQNQPAAGKRAAAAQQVIERTQRRGPTTLSDVKGAASPARANNAALSPHALLNKFESMSDEEIAAQLDRAG